MFSWLATGGMILSLLAPTNPVVDFPEPATPPPGQIVIDLVTVNGSGCPAGTAAIAMSADNTAFTVTYSAFIAQVGVGAGPTDWRRNCQLNLRVHVPQGFTYAVAQADYRGFAALADGASGVERANYYFQGMSPTAYTTHTFAGPMVDNWQATDVTDVASLVWHPCGEFRNFNINTELWALAGTSDTSTTTSFMTMDSTDGAISTTYNLAWKTCP